MSTETNLQVIISPAGAWNPSPDDLVNIRKLAGLKYTVSEICLALDIPGAEFRRRLTLEKDPVYLAYHAGRIEGDIPYRQRVMTAAARGEEWAVKMAESWARKQMEDELGCHV